MGCCTTKQPSDKRTLREANPDLNPVENKAEATYQGKKAKDVLYDTEIDQLLLAVKNGSSHLVEAICVKFTILNVCEVRGLQGDFELLKREKYNLSNWNLILVAAAFDHLQAIKFFTKQLQCHLRVALRSPPILGYSKMSESSPEQSETFSILLAINNKCDDMLKFLWNELPQLWDNFHLLYILEEMSYHKYVNGIKIILQSQTAHEIYLSMRTPEKQSFLTELLLKKQTKRTGDVKETLREELSLHPYASVALFVLITDEKFNYNQVQNHLDKALSELEVVEYGRYKCTSPSSLFSETIQSRVNDLATCEESVAQRQFGEKLRTKMETLNSEVTKLKHGFVNATEYDAILGQKLFDYAKDGDLKEFSATVIENDIRVFKRKRLQTVKLTSSFSINNYCYFTPLLVAIQNKHLPIVYFIMEKMKIGLRQALCLQAVDGEESFNSLDVSEDYQAYALLCACANKDEQMLRYLWETHGSHLWTERHFEPVMRYLIESEWCDGARIIFRSEITHQMIKAFSSEERSFFIENMIGDLEIREKINVLRVIKEELSLKPYAGIFIVYMIDRFDQLSEDELTNFWDPCTNNVYLAELKLLSAVNQTRFSKFILDYGIKRHDDHVKEQALKFIERLKEMPEYEPIIEEGVEEAIKHGLDEIKVLKKDRKQGENVKGVWEVIEACIMGQVKTVEKVVNEMGWNGKDLYDCRGFAVKCFDPENSILNTREWNPVHYAIFYRQLKTLQYLVQELGINLKIAMDFSHTYNEFIDDPTFKEILGNQYTYLYGFLLCVYSKDLPILKFLYEDMQSNIQLIDQDIIKILKMCIQSDWPTGFQFIVNSDITAQIFINSQLDFKEEFVHFCIAEEQIESKCINSIRNEDLVREIKERMVTYPYCAISWLFIDPFTHTDPKFVEFDPLKEASQKNERYIKLLRENFDLKSLEMLAHCGQIENVKKKCAKPQINLAFLDVNINDEEEKKQMEKEHQLQELLNKRMIEYQSFFTQKIEEWQSNIFSQNFLSDACEEIVQEYLKEPAEPLDEEKLKAIDQKLIYSQKDPKDDSQKQIHIRMVQFVSKFDSYPFWRKYSAKFPNIDMEYLNLFHWALFFNQSQFLQHLLQRFNSTDEADDNHQRYDVHLGTIFCGDHNVIKFEYEYQEKQDDGKEVDKILTFHKLGIVICVIQRSYECWDMLLSGKNSSPGLLSSQEILDTAIMICAEDWKQGLIPLLPYIQQVFQKISLSKRVEFIHKLLKLKTDAYKEVLKIDRILTFLEWMNDNSESDDRFRLNSEVKKLLPSSQAEKQKELKKIQFLARLKPQQVETNLLDQQQIPRPNDIINLNDITIEKKKSKGQKKDSSSDDEAEVQSD